MSDEIKDKQRWTELIDSSEDHTLSSSLSFEENRESLVGRTIGGHYEILCEIGCGGMSTVYKARHLLMDRIVAVKTILPQLVHDAKTTMRFQQEAKAAAELQHPNICAVREFGLDEEGHAFLVMDFIEGKTLSEVLKSDGNLGIERSFSIMSQIGRALAFAHAQGVIHRDLKPGNIVLMSDKHGQEIAKLVDFGIAKLLRDDDELGLDLTKTGEIFGTPKYMSTEQCTGKKVDARCDIYSFGAVLYECLSGVPPFVGESFYETVKLHLEADVPALLRLDKDYAYYETLDILMAKMLAKDPSERFNSIDEVLEALETVKSTEQRSIKLLEKAHKIRKRKSPRNWYQIASIGLLWGAMILTALKAYETYWGLGARVDTWEAHDRSGLELLNQGKYDHAYEEFGKAISSAEKEVNPDHVRNALEKCAVVAMILKREADVSSLRKRLAPLNEKPESTETDTLAELLDSASDNMLAPLQSKVKGLVSAKIASNDLAAAAKLSSKLIERVESLYGKYDARLVEPLLLLDKTLITQSQFAVPAGFERKQFVERASLHLTRVAQIAKGKSSVQSGKLSAITHLYLAYISAVKGSETEARAHLKALDSWSEKTGAKLDAEDSSIEADAHYILEDKKQAAAIYEKIVAQLEASYKNEQLLKKTVKLLTSFYLTDLKDISKARGFVDQRIVKFSGSGNNNSAILAHYYEMLAWIEDAANDQKRAFESYDKALRAVQATLPSTTWYDSPIFLAAVTFYQSQKRSELARMIDAYLRQQLASVDTFHQPRTDMYWSANDRLALQLLNSGKTKEAQTLFNASLERILSAKDTDVVLASQDFAMLTKGCLQDPTDRRRLLAKAGGFLAAAKKDWVSKTPGRSIEAAIYANQLMEYSLLSLQLGKKENALEVIMRAIELAEKGYLNRTTKLNAFNNYVCILRAVGRDEEAREIEKKYLLPAIDRVRSKRDPAKHFDSAEHMRTYLAVLKDKAFTH